MKKEINEWAVLDTEAVVTMELTYENMVEALSLIEAQHSLLKTKFIRAKDKHSRAKNKKSLYESAMRKISYEMDMLSMQYCDMLVVAHEQWWTNKLVNDARLQKWWAKQVEEMKEFLKQHSDKEFKENLTKWFVDINKRKENE